MREGWGRTQDLHKLWTLVCLAPLLALLLAFLWECCQRGASTERSEPWALQGKGTGSLLPAPHSPSPQGDEVSPVPASQILLQSILDTQQHPLMGIDAFSPHRSWNPSSPCFDQHPLSRQCLWTSLSALQ